MSAQIHILPPPEVSVEARPRWGFEGLKGRLTEISGRRARASLTVASALIEQAQSARDVAAWVAAGDSAFYPPDLAARGVDLRNLPVVFAPGPQAAARVADKLLRSGGFGLVVVDLTDAAGVARHGATVSMALLSRLVKLSQHHAAAVVFLTRKPGHQPSLGSLIALRGEATRVRQGEDRFGVRVEVIKDKRQGPGWTHEEVYRGPDGLR